jgi:hypothetical protein
VGSPIRTDAMKFPAKEWYPNASANRVPTDTPYKFPLYQTELFPQVSGDQTRIGTALSREDGI